MTVCTFVVLALVLHALSEINATPYASLASSDGFFKLQWTYNNNKLMFKMTCETLGWCAVGFTTTADGRNMVNYDIAVAGYTSDAGYVDDYWSSSLGPPPKDGTQNYNLTAASESGGDTVVEFFRDAVTGDNATDVQFTNETEVIVVYAYNSNDANAGLGKHTGTGILDGKHNLILMAIMSAIQPSSTAVGMSSTSTIQPTKTTPTDSAGVMGPYFASYIVLACLSVHFMSL